MLNANNRENRIHSGGLDFCTVYFGHTVRSAAILKYNLLWPNERKHTNLDIGKEYPREQVPLDRELACALQRITFPICTIHSHRLRKTCSNKLCAAVNLLFPPLPFFYAYFSFNCVQSSFDFSFAAHI